jgi:hypothetical protein
MTIVMKLRINKIVLIKKEKYVGNVLNLLSKQEFFENVPFL